MTKLSKIIHVIDWPGQQGLGDLKMTQYGSTAEQSIRVW